MEVHSCIYTMVQPYTSYTYSISSNFSPPSPEISSSGIAMLNTLTMAVSDNSLWLYDCMSYSNDVWTREKYDRLSRQQLDFLLTYNAGYYYCSVITADRGCALLGGKYDQRPDGLHISNVTSSDEGVYCCQAVVESSGMFKEQPVTLKLLGKNFVKIAS